MWASTSRISMRVSAPSLSIRQSSTLSATSENRAKFVPEPSYVDPRGYEFPGHTTGSGALSEDVADDPSLAVASSAAGEVACPDIVGASWSLSTIFSEACSCVFVMTLILAGRVDKP